MRANESLATFVVCAALCTASLSAGARARQSATQRPSTQTQQEAPPAKKNERPAVEAAQGDKYPEWKPGTEFKAKRDAMLKGTGAS